MPKATTTQGTPEPGVSASLKTAAAKMLEGSDLRQETAPSGASERATSEKPAPEVVPGGADTSALETARTRVDALLAEQVQTRQRLEQAQRETAQREKDRREAQSYGDRRYNEVQQQLAQANARVEELTQQVQSRREAVEQDEEFYGESQRQTKQRVASDPEVMALRQELADERQRRDAEIAQAKVQAEAQASSAAYVTSLTEWARQTSRDVYNKEFPQLTDREKSIMQQILVTKDQGDHDGTARLIAAATREATAESLLAVRERGAKSRVISEAGTNSATEGNVPQNVVEEVFRDLDFKGEGLTDPQIEQKLKRNLVTAGARLAHMDVDARVPSRKT